MDLRTYLLAVRKSWVVIVLAALLCLAAGAAAYFLTPKTYASTLDFYVSTPGTDERNPQSSGQFAEARVNSYILLLSSEQVAEEVADASGVDLSPQQVARRIEATSELDTVIVKTTVTDSSAERSLRIAEGLASAFPRLVDRLDNQGRRLDVVVVNVVSGPTLQPAPIAPDLRLYLGLGLAAGLVLGLVVAVVREALNNTIRSTEAAEQILSAPVLGTIGWDSELKSSPLIVGTQSTSPRAEAYRQLRTNLQFISATQSSRIILVTSAVALEGKSTTAVNLALTFVEAGEQVLLVDADLRSPSLWEYLELPNEVGLSNVLAGQVDLDDAIQPWGTKGLSFLASGSHPPNPSELLGSTQMQRVMSILEGRYDRIILDTSPVLPVTDAAVVSVYATAVLFVVRYGKTTRSQVARAIASLRNVGAKVVGTVLNMRQMTRTERKGYGERSYVTGMATTELRPASDRTIRGVRGQDETRLPRGPQGSTSSAVPNVDESETSTRSSRSR